MPLDEFGLREVLDMRRKGGTKDGEHTEERGFCLLDRFSEPTHRKVHKATLPLFNGVEIVHQESCKRR